MRPPADAVRRAAADLTFPDTPQTVGRLLDAAGRVLGEQIWSGRRGPGADASDLREDHPERMHLWATVRQHVEGHAAAWLRRQTGNQHLVLLVSREPCSDGERSCEVALRRIIPRGSSLTVFIARPGQDPVYYDTYDGNGEAIR